VEGLPLPLDLHLYRPALLLNPYQPSPREVVNAAQTAARNAAPSAALLDKARALKTLDLRGNELRVRPGATIEVHEVANFIFTDNLLANGLYLEHRS